MTSLDSFNCEREIKVGKTVYTYYDLNEAEKNGLNGISKLPKSLKVLLENLLRHEDGSTVIKDDILAMVDWLKTRTSTHEIAYRPARVLMQDFTGVPAVVDLAAMRDAMVDLGGKANAINPLNPVHLVIDHSVMVDYYGTKTAFKKNVEREYERNGERYDFLKWGQEAFDNFAVVPPGTGICHQVNLENLAQTVWTKSSGGKTYAFPDTLVGTDSHTTMINGLSVLGWGVGGIEAEAGMLGQPISMLIPEVIGFEVKNKMPEGTTATDLVLTVVKMLRDKGVVGKFVEFYGEGLKNLTLADRATIANMAPEYGATCGFFPIDEETLKYLRFSGRDESTVNIVEKYAKEQGLWANDQVEFTDTLSLDMSTVVPTISGPKRPQDKVLLTDASTGFKKVFEGATNRKEQHVSKVSGTDYEIKDGSILIAAITSCTNTSNPNVLIGAGLLAKKAVELGLETKPWVKTSLAPGSQVVTDYLAKAGLNVFLDKLGFNLVGYGCTTCIGNSGPLPEEIVQAIDKENIYAVSVLSGNRNFEGRVNPLVKANWLASPPLVVAYALAGTIDINLETDALGEGSDGQPVYLKDIWPTQEEVRQTVATAVVPEQFQNRYGNVWDSNERWNAVPTSEGALYDWQGDSTYVQEPPFLAELTREATPPVSVTGARVLLALGDSVTTDHISPAGAIAKDSPAGRYLVENGVPPEEFNSYGARRGNDRVMTRGTFANIRIRNLLAPGTEGGVTRLLPEGEQMAVYDAAMQYRERGVPLVVLAGAEYGTGSSRDWAAKGTMLLGVRAVMATSFERIHRSNLVGMGVLPLVLPKGWQELGLTGEETFDIPFDDLTPRSTLEVTATRADGTTVSLSCTVRIDTPVELDQFNAGGILPFVLRKLLAS